jgi:hypothetical protein
LEVESSTVKEIRTALRYQFDRGVIDLRIMANTGMEGSAAWVFDTAEQKRGNSTLNLRRRSMRS